MASKKSSWPVPWDGPSQARAFGRVSRTWKRRNSLLAKKFVPQSASVLHFSLLHRLHSKNFSSSSTSHEAFFHLNRCTNFTHLMQIHAQIIRNGLSDNQFILSNLIRISPSHYATLVFNQIQHQNPSSPPLTFTWNHIIRTHTVNSPNEALLLYNLMIVRGVPRDKFTFPFVIKACLVLGAVCKGKEVHGMAIKNGLSKDLFFENGLMDFYFKCKDYDSGRKVFEKMRVRSVVSWTTMLTGLVDCGELEAARGVFERMPVRNVVSWTAMINGYVRSQPHEAFELFRRMQVDNVMPNEFTMVGLLVACTELGNLMWGRRIHKFIIENGFELNVFLGTALVDMYGKCGSIEHAIEVFLDMEKKSLATWNSMITGLGVHGRAVEVLMLFSEMEKENVQPDAITFYGVLCAFVHMVAVKEGFKYFKYMSERYGITPFVEHYSCLVELLCRAGMLDEAYQLVKSMPVKPNDDIWGSLLRGSRIYGNADLEGVIWRHVGDPLSTSAFDVAQDPNQRLNYEVG